MQDTARKAYVWFVAGLSLLAGVGCSGRSSVCRRMASRNERCADAIEQVVASGVLASKAKRLGEKARRAFGKQVGREVRKAYTSKAFLDACQRAWAGRRPQDEKVQREAWACLAKKSCEDYARCILSLRLDRNM